jgi:hypothetical protein
MSSSKPPVFVPSAASQMRHVVWPACIFGCVAFLVVGGLLLFKTFASPSIPDNLTLESRFKQNMAKFGDWQSLRLTASTSSQLLTFSGWKNGRFVSLGVSAHSSPLLILGEVDVSTEETGLSKKGGRKIEIQYVKDFSVSRVRAFSYGGDYQNDHVAVSIDDQEQELAVGLANEMLYSLREWAVIK